MKKILFITTLLMLSSVFGQRIELTILNSKTKKPISEVHVKSFDKTYVSNKLGKVLLTGIKNDTLHLSHIKYETDVFLFKKTFKDTIFLNEKTIELSEVVVGGVMSKKLKIKELSSIPKGLYNFASILFNNKIYVFGGNESVLKNTLLKALEDMGDDPEASFDRFLREVRRNENFIKINKEVFVYNIENDKWFNLKSDLIKREGHKAVLVKDKVFVIGGKHLSKTMTREFLTKNIEVFDLKNNVVIEKIKNNHVGVNQGVETIDNGIFIIGGAVKEFKNKRKKFSKYITLYNTELKKWSLIGYLPESGEINCVRINEKLYLIGKGKRQNKVKITSFDLLNGKWNVERELPFKNSNSIICSYQDSIYIVVNKSLYVYEVKDRSLKKYSIDFPFEKGEILIKNDLMYLIGGYIEQNHERIPSEKMFSLDLNLLDKTQYKKM